MIDSTLVEPAWLSRITAKLDELAELGRLQEQLGSERERVRRLLVHRAALVKMVDKLRQERDSFEQIIIDRLSGKDTGKFKAL